MADERNIKDIIAELDNNSSLNAQNEFKEKALNICKQYIGSVWKKGGINEFSVSKLSGGLTNMVFLCSLADNAQPENAEPTKAILRVYYNADIDKNLVTETVVFMLLSEKKLGPKLFGTFEGGRLEEYIPSRALKYEELGNDRFSNEIAKSIARIHKLEMPIWKEPDFLSELLTQWITQLAEHTKPHDIITIPEKYSQWAPKSITVEELGQLVESTKKLIAKSQSKVVFCHNDILENNLLLVEKKDQDKNKANLDLVVSDFEFACYNYRGFEFANHFVEWTIDYDTKTPPFYEIDTNKLPSKARMTEFMVAYLKELHSTESTDNILEEATNLVEESLPFIPVDHMLWSVFCFLQVHLVSAADFDFAQIAQDRLGMYYQYKHLLDKLA